MIAINQSLIRSMRKADAEDSSLERMLSTSPPRGAIEEAEPELKAKKPQRKQDEDDDFEDFPRANEVKEAPAATRPAQQQQVRFNEEQMRESTRPQPNANPRDGAPAAPIAPHHAHSLSATSNATSASGSNVDLFAKEPVRPQPLVPSGSWLSREINASAHLQRRTHERVQPARDPSQAVRLLVYTAPELSLRVTVTGPATVEELIELVLRQYALEKRQPALKLSGNYDLRLLEDDDGTPDTDIPPLDRSADIHSFNVEAVALCERSEPLPDGQKDANRKKRGVSLEYNSNFGKTGKQYLKIHMPNYNVSHLIQVQSDMKLEDILPIIAKKRSQTQLEQILPKDYKFVYRGESDALEMDLPLSKLVSDELVLLPRISQEETLKTIPESEIHHTSTRSFMSREFAREYTEYKVIKTNQWGKKQERIMGIDGEKIYNKNATGGSDDVHRPFRLISEVLSIELVPNQPRCFRIAFRDKHGTEAREYAADSKIEAEKIVGKVNLLKSST